MIDPIHPTVRSHFAKAPALQVSVVIPMYNEAENIQSTVDQVASVLRTLEPGETWEIVVVNDGSQDDTWAIAKELAARPEYDWLRVAGYAHNRGRGFALRSGFAAARGRWVVSIDADLSYDPHYILDLLRVLREEEDVDLVLASAYMPGGKVEGVPLNRLLVSRLGNWLLSSFMSSSNTKIHTITCVFRAYRREVLDHLDLESEGKDIHLEILSKSLMLGYRMKEIPATLRSRKKGRSKFRFRSTAASHLVFALFEKPILVFGLIGLILLLGSFLGMAHVAWLWWRQTLNPERPLLIIIVIAFLGGLQLISFGVIGTQFVNLRKEMIRIQGRLKAHEREIDARRE